MNQPTNTINLKSITYLILELKSPQPLPCLIDDTLMLLVQGLASTEELSAKQFTTNDFSLHDLAVPERHSQGIGEIVSTG